MKYIEMNDEQKDIYEKLKRVPSPDRVACYPRDRLKEKEFYADKSTFLASRLPNHHWNVGETICMCAPQKGSNYKIYCFHEGNRTAMVAAQTKNLIIEYYGYPDTPVFYEQFMFEYAKYIVITDSLIFAVSLQKALCGRLPLTWVVTSFLERDDLPKLDFSIFSGKTVIYCLVEHSGYDWQTTCLNAMDLIKRFPEDTTVYILSYPDKGNYPSKYKLGPGFLSRPEDLEEEIESLKSHPIVFSTSQWQAPEAPEHIKIAEGVLSQTLIWLYDASPAIRTSYLTHWAASVSQGLENIQAHKAFPSRNIAYLYINPRDDCFTDGLQHAFENILNDKFSKPCFPPGPSSRPEAEILLTNADLFSKYPCIDTPLSKVQPKLYYFAFGQQSSLACNTSSEIFSLLDKSFENLERHHADIEIVILDIPFFWTLGIPMATLMEFFYILRSKYAVILSTNDPGTKQHSLINNLPFDSIVRMQRQKSSPEETSIDLVWERDDFERKDHTIRLIRGSDEKQWKSRCTVKYSVKEKIQYIQRHRDQEIKETAIKLGISESYVKKLRVMAGVSQKIPARAPRLPRRKTLYSI